MDKIQDEIIGEFSVFDDWLDKYDYLIELSDALPPIDAAHRTDRYLINGCQSRRRRFSQPISTSSTRSG